MTIDRASSCRCSRRVVAVPHGAIDGCPSELLHPDEGSLNAGFGELWRSLAADDLRDAALAFGRQLAESGFNQSAARRGKGDPEHSPKSDKPTTGVTRSSLAARAPHF